MNDEILKWLLTGQVGESSKVMASCFAGIPRNTDARPYDPSDFNRCLMFLAAVPQARLHMEKLREISPEWNLLVDNWAKLEATFIEEAGLGWSKSHNAEKTGRLMDKLWAAKPSRWIDGVGHGG